MTNATFSRDSKFGKIEVLSLGLSRIFINGVALNVAFYEDEPAINMANSDKRIAKQIKEDKKERELGTLV